ncbi:hypothetical protein [Ruminococcus champanellensis]|nr:hypothetical protein [Ruminococcus champanellensis]
MDKEYICDDRPVQISDKIAAMSDEEAEKAFNNLFGSVLTQQMDQQNIH